MAASPAADASVSGVPATEKTRRWLEVIVANPRSDEPPVAQVRHALRSFSSRSHLGMGRVHAPRGSSPCDRGTGGASLVPQPGGGMGRLRHAFRGVSCPESGRVSGAVRPPGQADGLAAPAHGSPARTRSRASTRPAALRIDALLPLRPLGAVTVSTGAGRWRFRCHQTCSARKSPSAG
jgi:hypothetical protein